MNIFLGLIALVIVILIVKQVIKNRREARFNRFMKESLAVKQVARLEKCIDNACNDCELPLVKPVKKAVKKTVAKVAKKVVKKSSK